MIQYFLSMLTSEPYFSSNFAFKGGTCLLKCYLDYYRFSEDLDFTWIDQLILQTLSTSKRKKIVSELIDKILVLVGKVSQKIGANFSQNKEDRNFIEFGGNEMRLTLKIHYESAILRTSSYLKIQINFFENLCFPIRNITGVKNILQEIGKMDDDTKLLFPEEYSAYTRSVDVKAYDIREIAAEKVRAILTRAGMKARDYVDLYLIEKTYGIKPDAIIDPTVKKIRFAVKWNERYGSNLQTKIEELRDGTLFRWGDETKFMLRKLDAEDFENYILDLEEILKTISKQVA